MAYRGTPKVDQGPKATFHADNLKLLSPALFANVEKQMSARGDQLAGRVTISMSRLDSDVAERLAEFLPMLARMPEPGSMQEHELRNKAIIDEAARNAEIAAKKKALEDSGHAQLAAYQKVGLLDTPKNAEIIRASIERYDGGVFCQISVRNAVEAERSNLQWGKIEAPPAAAPTPAPEPTITLSDGSKQLPLGTVPNRSHTIVQLRDLDARKRAAKSKHPGVFGTRF